MAAPRSLNKNNSGENSCLHGVASYAVIMLLLTDMVTPPSRQAHHAGSP